MKVSMMQVRCVGVRTYMVIQMGRSQIVTSMLTCFPVQLNMYTEILNSHRHFGHAVNRVQVK